MTINVTFKFSMIVDWMESKDSEENLIDEKCEKKSTRNNET